MAKIKEKPVIKDPKVLDKMSRMPKEAVRRGMDEGTERIRSQARDVQGHSDTPEDYAADRIDGATTEVSGRAGHAAENAVGMLRNRIKTKECYEQAHESTHAHRPDEPSRQPEGHATRQTPGVKRDTASLIRQDANAQAYQGGKRHAQRTAQSHRQTQRVSREALKRSAVKKGMVKTAAKGSVKTARHGIKTAGTMVKATGKSVKTAERTARATAKAAKETAKAAAKITKIAVQTAIRAARVATKATVTTIKAIIAAVKGLVAAIAAGGWVAVVIILAVGIIAAILCSAFGVFYSNEAGDGTPMTDAIAEIDTGFKAGVDAKITELSSGGYDAVNVIVRGDIDGDSVQINNWNDVLSVYAVMLTTDEAAAADVVVVTPEKLEKLKAIFNDMNRVSYQTEIATTEEIAENEDGEEETVTRTTLNIYITYNGLSYLEATDLYGFTEDQREVMDELMSPAYYSYFAALLGVDIYGGANLTEIVSNLPVGTKGAEVVKAAITKLGAPYVWGAKGPSKFDCSGFVYWSINEVDPVLGSSMRTNAAGQAKWCYTHDRAVGRSELQPGDLVFWQNLGCPGCHRWNEVHHTGIYIGDGKVIEASSSKGRVIIRDLWESKNYPLFMLARL